MQRWMMELTAMSFCVAATKVLMSSSFFDLI